MSDAELASITGALTGPCTKTNRYSAAATLNTDCATTFLTNTCANYGAVCSTVDVAGARNVECQNIDNNPCTESLAFCFRRTLSLCTNLFVLGKLVGCTCSDSITVPFNTRITCITDYDTASDGNK